MDGFMEEIENALKFKVEYTNLANPGIETAYNIDTKAEIPVKYRMENEILQGEGPGSYTGIKNPGIEDIKIEITMPNTYQVISEVRDFNPCVSDEISIYIDRFGAESEAVTISFPEDPDVPPKTTKAQGYVQKVASELFKDIKSDSFYKFVLPLNNGQEVAAEKTFKKEGKIFSGDYSIDFTLKLTHTPE
jgi:hypothetical protein